MPGLPAFQKMDDLREWVRQNTMEGFIVVWIGIGALTGYTFAHTALDMHKGVNSAIRVYMKENNVYTWYGELSDIKRREEQGLLSAQDEIDGVVFTRLILNGCRDLRAAGNLACDGLPLDR